jgi:hypothetical protein
VTPVNEHNAYAYALEKASVCEEIVVFATFLAVLVITITDMPSGRFHNRHRS